MIHILTDSTIPEQRIVWYIWHTVFTFAKLTLKWFWWWRLSWAPWHHMPHHSNHAFFLKVEHIWNMLSTISTAHYWRLNSSAAVTETEITIGNWYTCIGWKKICIVTFIIHTYILSMFFKRSMFYIKCFNTFCLALTLVLQQFTITIVSCQYFNISQCLASSWEHI